MLVVNLTVQFDCLPSKLTARIFFLVINRNTTIPTKKSSVFSTAADGQTAVDIKVFQGEREMAADNKYLGEFELSGIPMAPRGHPQIEVSFDIDANGILNVTAKDKGSGKEQSISITGASTLDKTEVERMVKQAEQNASTDKERREKVDRKNQADSLAYQAEKQIKDLGDKVPADDKTKVEGLVKDLRDAAAVDKTGDYGGNPGYPVIHRPLDSSCHQDS